MRPWAIMLGGLTVWAAHFFVLYAIASVLPGVPSARWYVVAATVPALIAAGLILRRALAAGAEDALDRWIFQVGALGAVIALVAIVWQAAPALLV